MRNKFEATAADGTVFKRSSANRLYTHCVVIHHPEWRSPADGRTWPAYMTAEWAGSHSLAMDNASRRAKRNRVEILEARRTTITRTS